MVFSTIASITAIILVLLYPTGPRDAFLLNSFANFLMIYTTFLTIFLAVVAFLLAFLESKRASLLSQKLSENTPEFWSGLLTRTMSRYRDTAKIFLLFAKVVIGTFAILILVTAFAYARTGWINPPDPILTFVNYLDTSYFVVPVVDVLLTILFFTF